MTALRLSNAWSMICLLVVASTITTHAFCPSRSSRAAAATVVSRSAIRYSPYDDDVVLQLPLLEAQLATTGPNPALQSSIEDAKTAAELSVRRAQMEFYMAFGTQDIELMRKVWSIEHHCRCVHPGMPSMEGRVAVLDSWEQVFRTGNRFYVEPKINAHIEVIGNTAICSCTESMNGGGELEAVNIYKREDGNWRLTMHMSSPVVRRVE